MLLYLFAGNLAAQAEVYADDFTFQKTILINDNFSCQAVQIHKDWLLTAAHCVAPFVHKTPCYVRVIAAQGSTAKASAVLSCTEVSIPNEVDTNGQTHILWDMALIHYPVGEVTYEFHDAENNAISTDGFTKALQHDSLLRTQWKERVSKHLPQLYTYQSNAGKILQNGLLVPRWTGEQLTYLTSPQTVLYLGQKQAVWTTVGFGVNHGNSGGAVLALREHGRPVLIGIVSAKQENTLSESAKQQFPQFAQAEEFFIFTGFSDKTTLAFIKRTLAQYHDFISVKKIRKVLDEQGNETSYLKAK